MNITDISVKRPIGTIMFFVGVLLLGYVSLKNLSINLLPDLSYPKITVLTEYPGSGPEEVERFITTVLEGPLSSIKGIKKVDSVSKEGLSIITLEFHWGTDMDFSLLHTKEKIEEVRRYLPDDCRTPIILEWDPASSPIIIALLKSKTMNLDELKNTAKYIVKQRLEQLEGIARVEIRGGNEKEVSVEISPEKIKNLGISLDDVSSVIKNNNVFVSGGTIRKDKYRYTLKIEGEIKSPEEINKLVVKKVGKRFIRISDIGNAFYKNKIKQGDIRHNGYESIALLIYRESSGNTVEATKIAEKTLKKITNEVNDLDYYIVSKEADLIISSINSLKSSLYLGSILAFIVLLLFLQNFKDPLLISIVIPISIISTFVLMYFARVNVNIMSLGGLVLGVGMFVDNSIIVLEALFRHRGEKQNIEDIIKGANEVSGAITASTFTTISIFLPVIYLYGITGKLFRDQALTVSFSLISSLIVAITLLPALSSLKASFKKKIDDYDLNKVKFSFNFKSLINFIQTILILILKLIGKIIYFILSALFISLFRIFWYISKFINFILKPFFNKFNYLYEKFDDVYHYYLIKVLDKKIYAVWISLMIIILIGLTFFGLRKELLPTPETGKFEVKALTYPYYGFEYTDKLSKKLEDYIREIKGVQSVYSESGAVSEMGVRGEDYSVNSVHLIVTCENNKVRKRVMNLVRNKIKSLDFKSFSIFLEKNTLSKYLQTGENNFQLKVFYEDIEKGRSFVRRVLKQISDINELNDLKANISEGKPLYVLKYNEKNLMDLNIDKKTIADYINQAVRGEKASELKKIQETFDIFVRIPTKGYLDVDRLLKLPINIQGNIYYLKDFVSFSKKPSIKEISRESQERYFVISSNVKEKKLDFVINKVEKRLRNMDLPDGIRYVFSGESEERQKAFDSLNQAILLAIILVYMVMAGKFENIVQPFIIMFTVPMGIFGAFLFLLITGNSLNVISGIGLMVLIGIGVNDAIVKVEYSNQLRKEGLSIREAVLQASKVRLRPILMTSFTTIFGLIPMAITSSTGSELQRPLALVIIGGLIFTTFLTLILIPVFYEALEQYKIKNK